MVKYPTKGKLPNRHLYCLISKPLEDSYCRAEHALVFFWLHLFEFRNAAVCKVCWEKSTDCRKNKHIAASNNTEEGRVVTNICPELFRNLQWWVCFEALQCCNFSSSFFLLQEGKVIPYYELYVQECTFGCTVSIAHELEFCHFPKLLLPCHDKMWFRLYMNMLYETR